MLRNEDEAFDVTQDTFLAYMRSKPSLRGEASAFTVLYQIATFKAVDRLRRASRWQGLLGPLAIPDEPSTDRPDTGAPSNGGGLARIEAMRDLALLTGGESAQTITAVFLYYAEGYSLEEVGITLDLDRKKAAAIIRGFAERARQRSLRLHRGGTQ